jgi:hypothetical protein
MPDRRSPAAMTRTASVAVAAAVACCVASAQPGPNVVEVYKAPPLPVVEPSGRVAELIALLANDSWESRATASEALLAMGPAIEAQVRWAFEREAPAARAAETDFAPKVSSPEPVQYSVAHVAPRYAYYELASLISRLHERSVATTSTVTLRATDAPVTDILRDLGVQSAADLSVQAYASGPLDWVRTARATLEVHGTYWDALNAIQRTLGLRRYDFGRWSGHLTPSVLSLTRKTMLPDQARPIFDVPGATVSGPLLIAPTDVELRRSVDVASGIETRRVVLTIQAVAEPKFGGVGRHALVTIDQCVDDQGQSLLRRDRSTFPSTIRAGTASSPWFWHVPIDLEAPPLGRRIRTVRGTFSIGTGPGSGDLIAGDLDKPGVHALHFEGVVVTIRTTGPMSGRIDVNLEISMPAGSPMSRPGDRASDDNAPQGYFSLLDQNRRPMGVSSWFWDAERQGDRDIIRARLTTTNPAQQPTTLRWLPPAETRWFTVPFELRDIAVPRAQ